MKSILALIFLLMLFNMTCKSKVNSDEKGVSQSYADIKPFLDDAKIYDKELVYFYSGKPRFPLPNVYCFDNTGIQLSSPPHCFGYITPYVKLLNDSTVPPKPDGETFQHFLDSTAILNVFDEVVDARSFRDYDYYLIIDYLAIPVESMKVTLYEAVEVVKKSDKKIKLFLVHAVSEKNKKFLKTQADSNKDTTTKE